MRQLGQQSSSSCAAPQLQFEWMCVYCTFYLTSYTSDEHTHDARGAGAKANISASPGRFLYLIYVFLAIGIALAYDVHESTEGAGKRGRHDAGVSRSRLSLSSLALVSVGLLHTARYHQQPSGTLARSSFITGSARDTLEKKTGLVWSCLV